MTRASKTTIGQWQPIESAPKDGCEILAYQPESGEQFVVYWNGDGWQYAVVQIAGVQHEIRCDPSHWHPIPAPPSDAALGNPEVAR
jgi:hypothetical protein